MERGNHPVHLVQEHWENRGFGAEPNHSLRLKQNNLLSVVGQVVSGVHLAALDQRDAVHRAETHTSQAASGTALAPLDNSDGFLLKMGTHALELELDALLAHVSLMTRGEAEVEPPILLVDLHLVDLQVAELLYVELVEHKLTGPLHVNGCVLGDLARALSEAKGCNVHAEAVRLSGSSPLLELLVQGAIESLVESNSGLGSDFRIALTLILHRSDLLLHLVSNTGERVSIEASQIHGNIFILNLGVDFVSKDTRAVIDFDLG